MNHAKVYWRVAVCALGLLAVEPVSASAAQPAPAPAASGEIKVERVAHVLESAGYAVGPAHVFEDQTLVIEGRANGGLIVRAFVYADVDAAASARRQAAAKSEALSSGDDAGPQLLSGFGASTWRRNIALVQSSPDTFAELMPAEVDCTDLSPLNRLDLSRSKYRVDASVVALIDALR